MNPPNVFHITSLSTKPCIHKRYDYFAMESNFGRQINKMSFQLRSVLLKSVLVVCICAVVITIPIEHTLKEEDRFDTGCELITFE